MHVPLKERCRLHQRDRLLICQYRLTRYTCNWADRTRTRLTAVTSRFKLSGGDTLLKHPVNLEIRPVFGLGHPQKGVRYAKDPNAQPEPAGLGAPVEIGSRKHARQELTTGNVGDNVGGAGDGDRFVSEARVGNLANDCIADRSNRKLCRSAHEFKAEMMIW